MEWISVKEKTPHNEVWVLGFYEGTDAGEYSEYAVVQYLLEHDYWIYETADGLHATINEPSHWCIITPPPSIQLEDAKG